MEGNVVIETYYWYHICINQGNINTLYFNDKWFLLNVSSSKTAIDVTEEVTITIGANNVGHFAFSGMVADVRLYFRNLNATEVEKVKKFETSQDNYITLLNTDFGTFNLDSVIDYVPNNDYLDIEHTLRILFYFYKKTYITKPAKDVVLYFFPEKVDCLKAKDICFRFGGQIPDYKNKSSILELSDLIIEYAITTKKQISNFWLHDLNSKVNSCIQAHYSIRLSSLFVDESFVSKKNSLVCIVKKNTALNGKVDFDTGNFIAIPNTFHVYDDIFRYTRMIYDDKYGKIKAVDLRYNRETYEMQHLNSELSNFIGRHTYTSLSDKSITFASVISVCVGENFTCSNGYCTDMTNVCDYQIDCEDGSDEEFCEVGIDPEISYEKRIAPRTEENKAKITLNLTLSRITSIDVDENTIKLMLNLRVSWIDWRLKFKNLLENNSLAIDPEIASKYWLPKITIDEGISVQDKTAFNFDLYPSDTYASKLRSGSYDIMNGYEGNVLKIYLFIFFYILISV